MKGIQSGKWQKPGLARQPSILDAVREEMLPVISITALNDPITIVHVPLDIQHDSHASAIFWTLERAATESTEFFNITSNRAELAIFAAAELVQDEWVGKQGGDADANANARRVRLSGPWRVFEIGSGDVDDELETGNYDSPHLRFVSAPLAKEGITILYQSSYHADFLLVKETDFHRASFVFGSQGWTINPTATPSPRHSAYTTPISPLSPLVSDTYPRNPSVNPVSLLAATRPISHSPQLAQSSVPPANTTTVLNQSHSPPPFTPEITLLPSPLAMVGFHASSPNFSLHVAQIQKFVTWPARCIAASVTSPSWTSQTQAFSDNGTRIAPLAYTAERTFISYTRTQDGASLVTDVRAIRAMFADTEGMLCGEEIGKAWESEAESDFDLEDSGDETEISDDDGDDTHHIQDPPTLSINSGSPIKREDNDDTPTPRACASYSNAKCSPSVTNTSPQGSYFPPNIAQSPKSPIVRQKEKWEKHARSQSDPITGAGVDQNQRRDSSPRRGRQSRPSGLPHRHTAVPLTPSSSGVGVACSWAPDENGGGGGLHLRGTKKGGEKRKGRKRCLQLDLSGVRTGSDEQEGVFHLDRSGLVTRFSTLLQRNNIRMLYSSTFHTANILVEAQDVRLAREVLTPSRRTT